MGFSALYDKVPKVFGKLVKWAVANGRCTQV